MDNHYSDFCTHKIETASQKTVLFSKNILYKQ